MNGHSITTVYVVARECAATREAIAQWRAGIAIAGLASEVISADEALVHFRRDDVSFLIDGVDEHDLLKKIRLARIAHAAAHCHERAIVVFLQSHHRMGQVLGLVPNSFFWLHDPEMPMELCYEHLAGRNLVEMSEQYLLA